jgi:hypothetical protein
VTPTPHAVTFVSAASRSFMQECVCSLQAAPHMHMMHLFCQMHLISSRGAVLLSSKCAHTWCASSSVFAIRVGDTCKPIQLKVTSGRLSAGILPPDMSKVLITRPHGVVLSAWFEAEVLLQYTLGCCYCVACMLLYQQDASAVCIATRTGSKSTCVYNGTRERVLSL